MTCQNRVGPSRQGRLWRVGQPQNLLIVLPGVLVIANSIRVLCRRYQELSQLFSFLFHRKEAVKQLPVTRVYIA